MHDVQWQIPPLLSALGKSQLHILLFLQTLTSPPGVKNNLCAEWVLIVH